MIFILWAKSMHVEFEPNGNLRKQYEYDDNIYCTTGN